MSKRPWLALPVGLVLGLAWVARPLLLPPAGEPLAVLGQAQEVAGSSLLLVGDTAFGESYGRNPATDQGYDPAFARLRGLLGSASLVVGNLETPLYRESPWWVRHVKQYAHWADPDLTAAALERAGFGAVSLANNHAYDGLAPGLLATRAALDAHGIASFGAGSNLAEAARPFRCDLRGARVAVIGAFAQEWSDLLTGAYATASGGGTYPLAARTITGQIRAIKQADPDQFVVAFPHWGDNYRWATGAERELAGQMLDAGADLVVGHGAHLFQEVEIRDGRLIVYGLGNFVFLSPGRYAAREMHSWSLAARLDFARATLSASLYFVTSDNRATRYQPRVLDGPDFDRARELLLARSPGLDAAARVERDAVGPHLVIALTRSSRAPR
jgi:poly-gamma-glutamate capsule biosynthesis protein CapA/YwtB (metallophosphatase superfamily)